MAVIIDEVAAKLSSCKCYYIGDDPDILRRLREGKITVKNLGEQGIKPSEVMCFSEGMIGTLTDEQDERYCVTKQIDYSPRLKQRLRCLSMCAKSC
jgi:hypothetical protein